MYWQSYFNLKTDDEFLRYRGGKHAVANGWMMAYLIYWSTP